MVKTVFCQVPGTTPVSNIAVNAASKTVWQSVVLYFKSSATKPCSSGDLFRCNFCKAARSSKVDHGNSVGVCGRTGWSASPWNNVSRFSGKSSTATSAPFVCARPCCDTRFNAAQLVVERNKFGQTCVFHLRTSDRCSFWIWKVKILRSSWTCVCRLCCRGDCIWQNGLNLMRRRPGSPPKFPATSKAFSISPQAGLSTNAYWVSKTFRYNDGSPAASKNGTHDFNDLLRASLLTCRPGNLKTQCAHRWSTPTATISSFQTLSTNILESDNTKSIWTSAPSNALLHVQLSSAKFSSNCRFKTTRPCISTQWTNLSPLADRQPAGPNTRSIIRGLQGTNLSIEVAPNHGHASMPSAIIDQGGQKFVDLVYSVVRVPSSRKMDKAWQGMAFVGWVRCFAHKSV